MQTFRGTIGKDKRGVFWFIYPSNRPCRATWTLPRRITNTKKILPDIYKTSCDHACVPFVETELLRAFAKTAQLSYPEDLVYTPNVADMQLIGSRCYQAIMFKAVETLCSNIFNPQQSCDCAYPAESMEALLIQQARQNWRRLKPSQYGTHTVTWMPPCSTYGLRIIMHAEELEDLMRTWRTKWICRTSWWNR